MPVSGPPSSVPPHRPRVLLVDDDEIVRCAVAGMLEETNHDVVLAATSAEALMLTEDAHLDVVISDIDMPDLDGIGLLRALRARQTFLPVVFLTGTPSMETAVRALEHGAFRYLTKPPRAEELADVIRAAILARMSSRTLDALRTRAALEARFNRALDTLWMAAQPIVSASTRAVSAYELLLRSPEPRLDTASLVVEAAEKLSAIHTLGRRVRDLASTLIREGPPDFTYFVNVHPADLADAQLIDPEAPLSKLAHRVVLEITERSSLEGISDLARRIDALRDLGYRIALDDLGAGYAGLTYFALLKPDLVKIDMSLVRGIDRDPVRREVVSSITSLARTLGMEVVGEGIQTREERDALIDLGCAHLQGFLFARPGRPYPEPVWGDG